MDKSNKDQRGLSSRVCDEERKSRRRGQEVLKQAEQQEQQHEERHHDHQQPRQNNNEDNHPLKRASGDEEDQEDCNLTTSSDRQAFATNNSYGRPPHLDINSSSSSSSFANDAATATHPPPPLQSMSSILLHHQRQQMIVMAAADRQARLTAAILENDPTTTTAAAAVLLLQQQQERRQLQQRRVPLLYYQQGYFRYPATVYGVRPVDAFSSSSSLLLPSTAPPPSSAVLGCSSSSSSSARQYYGHVSSSPSTRGGMLYCDDDKKDHYLSNQLRRGEDGGDHEESNPLTAQALPSSRPRGDGRKRRYAGVVAAAAASAGGSFGRGNTSRRDGCCEPGTPARGRPVSSSSNLTTRGRCGSTGRQEARRGEGRRPQDDTPLLKRIYYRTPEEDEPSRFEQHSRPVKKRATSIDDYAPHRRAARLSRTTCQEEAEQILPSNGASASNSPRDEKDEHSHPYETHDRPSTQMNVAARLSSSSATRVCSTQQQENQKAAWRGLAAPTVTGRKYAETQQGSSPRRRTDNVKMMPSPSRDSLCDNSDSGSAAITEEDSLNRNSKNEELSRSQTASDEHWNIMFRRLLRYKEVNGDCLVPQRYAQDSKLGKWVCYQRKRKENLAEERRRKLEEVGFVFSVRRLETWDAMFDQLVEYKAKHGDCLVPQNYAENPKLGKWIAIQRIYRDSLTADRLKRMESIGFVWSVNEALWDTMFQSLLSYKNEKGHCRVPWNYKEDPQLANWVQRQKKNRKRLSADRMERLQSIGFEL